jgi:hypothetical protein
MLESFYNASGYNASGAVLIHAALGFRGHWHLPVAFKNGYVAESLLSALLQMPR